MKIFLHYIGKARDAHANAMAAEYVKRTSRYTRCEMREIDPRRFDVWAKYPSGMKILLDPAGRVVDSAGFHELVRTAQREARDLVFVIGGASGLPDDWRERADLLLSLTPLTLPHELARVILAEQIYRALATASGHPYAR